MSSLKTCLDLYKWLQSAVLQKDQNWPFETWYVGTGWTVWANTNAFFFKHSLGSYRIITSLLVASLTFSVPSLWTIAPSSLFLSCLRVLFVYHLSLVTTSVAEWYNLALWSPNHSGMQSGSSHFSGVAPLISQEFGKAATKGRKQLILYTLTSLSLPALCKKKKCVFGFVCLWVFVCLCGMGCFFFTLNN